jgi:hypothetical protein
VPDPDPAWTAALSLLTEREAAVLSLRRGALGGPHQSFAALAKQLGMSRQRAYQLYERAMGVLRNREETQELAARLAPMPEAIGPVGEETESSAELDVVDSAPSERDVEIAMKLVAEAERELGAALEACRDSGDHELVAALGSGRTVVATHLRELGLAATPPGPPLAIHRDGTDHDKAVRFARRYPGRPARDPSLPKRGRGRPVDPARLAMLERVHRGELDHATAAAELGLKRPAWTQWVAYHEQKAVGSAEAPREITRASVEPAGKGRGGRPFNVEKNARRAALLARLNAGELTNAEAAAELGIKVSAWSSWKGLHRKRMGAEPRKMAGNAARAGKRGRPEDKAEIGGAGDLAQRLARLDQLERFGRELKQRLRDLVRLVDQALG